SLLIRARVKESDVWRSARERMRSTGTSIRGVLLNPKVIRRFVYLILLMTAFNWMAHGTQDIYPNFLSSHTDGGAGLSTATAKWIAVLYNLGAITGGLIF